MKAFDYNLKLGPVIGGSFIMLVALGTVFFTLYVYRIQHLDRVDFSDCAQQKTYLAASKCVGLKVRDHIKHPRWQAVQFVCFILVAMAVGALTAWMAGAQYWVAASLVGVISALVGAMLFKPHGFLPLAALLGALLGCALFHVFVIKHRFPAKNRPAADNDKVG